jgi:hypothetical protein
MNRLLALIILMALSLPVAAEYNHDGNSLLRLCTDDGTSSICVGYAAGVRDTHISLLNKDDYLFCMEFGTVPNGQLTKIIVKYLNDHPEKLHLPDRILVLEAYIEAFPCG